MTEPDQDVAREREELEIAERTLDEVVNSRYATAYDVEVAGARVRTEALDVAPAEREAALARAAEVEQSRWEDATAEHRTQQAYAADYDQIERERSVDEERDRQRVR